MIRDEELIRGEPILVLVELIEEHGIERVHRLIRNIGRALGKNVCVSDDARTQGQVHRVNSDAGESF